MQGYRIHRLVAATARTEDELNDLVVEERRRVGQRMFVLKKTLNDRKEQRSHVLSYYLQSFGESLAKNQGNWVRLPRRQLRLVICTYQEDEVSDEEDRGAKSP